MMQKSPAFFQPTTLTSVYRLIAEAEVTAWPQAQGYAVLLLDASKSYMPGLQSQQGALKKDQIKGFYSEKCLV